MQFDPKLDNTLCNYPFMELALKDWGGNGKIRRASMCCNMMRPENKDPLNIGTDLDHLSIDEIWNHDNVKQLRKDLLNGVKNSACDVCWKMEKDTGDSYRLNSKQNHVDIDIDTENPILQMVDLSTGDACNLRCQMCHPGTSNQLRTDLQGFKELGYHHEYWMDYNKKDPHKYFNKGAPNKAFHEPDVNSEQWKDLKNKLKYIKKLNATGGETLVARPFIDLMDYAIKSGDAKHISLDFTTNATKFTKANIERFNQFEKLSPTLSIDAIGTTYDYCRWPADWNKIDKNIKEFVENCTSLHSIHVNYVLQTYNALDILDTVEYFEKIYETYNIATIFHIDLIFPIGRFTDVKHLPKDILQKSKEQIQKSLDKERENLYINIRKASNYVDKVLEEHITDDNMLRKLSIDTYMFDTVRKRHYSDYLKPEITNFLKMLEMKYVR